MNIRVTPYMTNKARESACEKIADLIQVVGKVPGDVIGYTDATALIHYLSDYADLIRRDMD